MPWAPPVGVHKIGAIPYSGLDGQGATTGPRTTVTMTVVAFGVTDLLLLNEDSDRPIQSLVSGATIRLSALPTRSLNIQATTSPSSVGSVRFEYNGNANYRTEYSAPYMMGENNVFWTLSVGSHTVTARSFDSAGKEGASRTVSFRVVA
jgi:hypothetical protein